MSVRFRLVSTFVASVSLVGDGMPEKMHAPMPGDEPRAVDDVGLAGEERLQQHVVLRRVVFQVGVLDDQELACRLLNAPAYRRPLALVVRLLEQPDHVRVTGSQRRQDLGRAVGRAVIDHDNLLRHVDGDDTSDELTNGVALVVDRNDDRKLGWRHKATDRDPAGP